MLISPSNTGFCKSFVSVNNHLSDLPSFPHYAYSKESMIGCKYLYPAEPSEAVESFNTHKMKNIPLLLILFNLNCEFIKCVCR